jgi:hypothetical protein
MSVPAPPIDTLLDDVRAALEREYGLRATTLSVADTQKRLYSTIWRLKIESAQMNADCLLKWLPLGAARERELTALSGALFAGEAWVRAPRIACNPTGQTFLVELLPGRPLDETYGLFGPDPVLLRRAGMWLSRFHAATASGKTVSGEGLRTYVWNRRGSFLALPPGLAELLLERLDAMPPHLAVRAHCDFTPHNLLLDGGSLAVIDFAGIREFDFGSPWFDTGCMVAGLEWSWRRRRRNALHWWSFPVERGLAAFREGYGVQVADLPLLAAGAAVRHFTMIHGVYSTNGQVPSSNGWEVRALRRALSV